MFCIFTFNIKLNFKSYTNEFISSLHIHQISKSKYIIMKQISASNQNYTKQQYLRDLLELAKQRMLTGITTNITNVTSLQISTSSSSSHAIERVNMNMNANIVEIILGVGYVLIIIAFLVKQFLKTLRRFEYYYASSSDGTYNRFGFIANEYSDSDFENDNDDVVESSPSSPVSLRHALAHLPLVTPLQKITTVTPQTPSPPPVRRSLRLKIKSELNLTSIMEKQNKTNVETNTNVVTRSQTRRRNQSQNQNYVTHERLAISSEPAPSCSFNRSHGSIITPSLHPENDEELAYYLQRCYERKMKKRSEFNSPLVVRRLVL